MERCYQQGYLPFVQLLEKHPAIRAGLHYSAALPHGMESPHPESFDLLGSLFRRQQEKLVGGDFFEPILAVIPPEDQREQIERLSSYIEQHFGERPAGAWLAER